MSKKAIWRDYFTLRAVNKVIKYLTISDFIMLSSLGLITPIFAVFITDNINGGNLKVVGIASAIYLLVQSIVQIPVAALIDKKKGERDDFWTLFIGSMIYSLIPLLYIFVRSPGQLYLVQFVYASSSAFVLPAWYAIFTRHIDKTHEGLEWGVYTTLTNLGMAVSASLGGFLASEYGFNKLFIASSIISFVGTMFIAGVYKSMKKGFIIFNY